MSSSPRPSFDGTDRASARSGTGSRDEVEPVARAIDSEIAKLVRTMALANPLARAAIASCGAIQEAMIHGADRALVWSIGIGSSFGQRQASIRCALDISARRKQSRTTPPTPF